VSNLLVFDIGNTNICLGVFNKKQLVAEFRLKTDSDRTIDEYKAVIITLLKDKLGEQLPISAVAISSVVPPITPDIIQLVEECFSLSPLVVSHGIKTGLELKVQEPASVGADRLTNAVAAKYLYGSPSLVVDFGTATTIDYLSSQGNYEGGVIIPGVRTSLDSLVRNTAKLPRIELAWPKSVIGKTTIECMQIGAVTGYACMLDGLIHRIVSEVEPITNIIATGGLGRVFAEHCKSINSYNPSLTLEGMRILAELNGIA